MASNEKNTVIRVNCYSGYKADEKPVSFMLGEKKLRIEKVIGQWRSPDFERFKVRADDGKVYLIRKDNIKGDWELE